MVTTSALKVTIAIAQAVAKVAVGGAIVMAFIDPAWAVPIQTLLLIILTVLGGNIRQKVKANQEQGQATHDAAVSAKVNATHAASAAAAAAAVARDSNRIAKDVGALFRSQAQGTTPAPTDEEGPTP